MTDDLIREISKSIQGLYDLTTRVDEQIKIIKEQQDKLDRRISEDLDSLHTDIKDINHELHLLDKRVTMLENANRSHEKNWGTVAGYLFQGIFIIIICYLLYLLKLQTTPLP